MKTQRVIEPFYATKLGQAFHGNSMEIMSEFADSSVNLILTSPPFALTRQKEYGNKLERATLIGFCNSRNIFIDYWPRMVRS